MDFWRIPTFPFSGSNVRSMFGNLSWIRGVGLILVKKKKKENEETTGGLKSHEKLQLM